MSNLYENIDYMCKQNGTNITQVCKSIPISRSVFSELKSGRTKDLSSENRKLIAAYFKVDQEYLDKDFDTIPCPLCGLQYSGNNPDEEIKHEARHAKWLKAVKKFGFCWNWQYRESVKAKARSKIYDNNILADEKVECYEAVYKALFSRALEANDYPLDYITFEEYVSGLLGDKTNSPDERSEEYKMLVDKYGIKKGLLRGTYFNTGNVPIQSQDYLIDKYNSIDPEILEKHNGDLDAAYAEQQLIDEQESRKVAHAIVNTHNINENPLKDEPSNISEVIPNSKIYQIPVFESVSAGFGAYANDCVIDMLPMVIDNPYDVPDTIAIKVTGDSMYPKIEDGDLIVVRKQESVDSGDVAVMLLDGDEGLVKKVIYGDTWIELHSFNPEYKTRRFDNEEVLRLRVVGKVLKVVKTL